jgi:predicted O-methyltransferase YrrM
MKNAVWDENELATLRFIDQIMPSQPHLSKMFNGDGFSERMAAMLFSVLDDDGEIKFKVKLKEGMSYAAMGSGINTLHFFQFLIRMGRYKHILELGTYIGVSTMYLAEAAKENDGSVTTVEIGQEFYGIAKDNFIANGFEPYIWYALDDCVNFLKNIENTYDFILIDAAKQSYMELLELSIKHLEPNGLIIVDDVFFQGDALNSAPTSEKGLGVKRCVEYAASLEGWERVILPIGNGLMLMRRKP